MTPDALFALANPVAMAGWIALLVFPRQRLVTWWLAGVGIPLLLSAGYAVALGIGLPGATGGFGSLADVAALFASPWVLLAGWLHYLAFDLFIGAWITRRAMAEGLPRWTLFAALPPTFLAGPLGLLVFFGLRRVLGR
ncbi:MAG: ABA4-like family protein [Rubritepida sp.]|nr:ABA4-like family protein [Rubritepida sp.]MCU0944399.1 ABA4-like family protein [Rubritepida sp.]